MVVNVASTVLFAQICAPRMIQIGKAEAVQYIYLMRKTTFKSQLVQSILLKPYNNVFFCDKLCLLFLRICDVISKCLYLFDITLIKNISVICYFEQKRQKKEKKYGKI